MKKKSTYNPRRYENIRKHDYEYLIVSSDKYEIPIAGASSAIELCRMINSTGLCKISISAIRNASCKGSNILIQGIPHKVVKVDLIGVMD